jgi:hypothetical protein
MVRAKVIASLLLSVLPQLNKLDELTTTWLSHAKYAG